MINKNKNWRVFPLSPRFILHVIWSITIDLKKKKRNVTAEFRSCVGSSRAPLRFPRIGSCAAPPDIRSSRRPYPVTWMSRDSATHHSIFPLSFFLSFSLLGIITEGKKKKKKKNWRISIVCWRVSQAKHDCEREFQIEDGNTKNGADSRNAKLFFGFFGI